MASCWVLWPETGMERAHVLFKALANVAASRLGLNGEAEPWELWLSYIEC